MSKVKPTIFSVLDVETCRPSAGKAYGLVFDVAWRNIDRKGRVYGEGSFLAKDVVGKHIPYFVEKMGIYYQLAYDRAIEPATFAEISNEYNTQLEKLQKDGHKVIFCAYNAQFDSRALGYTAGLMNMTRFLRVKMPLLCIWHYWAMNCPKTYTAKKTASGKFYSTTAEDVYRFEFQDEGFIEEHIGYSDVIDECDILLKVLNRKRKLPLVNSIAELPGSVYRIANERLGMC